MAPLRASLYDACNIYEYGKKYVTQIQEVLCVGTICDGTDFIRGLKTENQ
jgi:hypothetical protein